MKDSHTKLYRQHRRDEGDDEGGITLNLIHTIDADKRTAVEAQDGYSVHCSQKPTKYWKTPLHGTSVEMSKDEGEQYFKDLEVRMYHNDRNDAHCRAKGIPTFDEWLEHEPTIDDIEWVEDFKAEANAEERALAKKLRHHRFHANLEEDFTTEGITAFWRILEANEIGDWRFLLEERLGTMDKGDADSIIDVYNQLPDEVAEYGSQVGLTQPYEEEGRD
jgi:hypothetical protein